LDYVFLFISDFMTPIGFQMLNPKVSQRKWNLSRNAILSKVNLLFASQRTFVHSLNRSVK